MLRQTWKITVNFIHRRKSIIRNRLPVLSGGEWICDKKKQAPGRNVTSEYYNKTARDLRSTRKKEGDTVRYRVSENNWAGHGVVKSKEKRFIPPGRILSNLKTEK